MAKFLNTSATNYFLEELIKGAKDRLILISPFLKLNDRMKELLSDKNRLKIDVRVVYGKSELLPEEINWLTSLLYIRTSFCKNLHAKCYLNEEFCIITSLNLYEFSQVNNNEMGVLISREEDAAVYREAYEEAQRIIRISEEVRISLERVTPLETASPKPSIGTAEIIKKRVEVGVVPPAKASTPIPRPKELVTVGSDLPLEKLTTAKLGQKLGYKTAEVFEKLMAAGLLEDRDGKHYITAKGKEEGGEFRLGAGYSYFLWPENLAL